MIKQDSGFVILEPRKITNDDQLQYQLPKNYSVCTKSATINFVRYRANEIISCGLDCYSFLETMTIEIFFADPVNFKIKFLGVMSKFVYNDTSGLYELHQTDSSNTIIDFTELKLIGTVYAPSHNNHYFISFKKSI